MVINPIRAEEDDEENGKARFDSKIEMALLKSRRVFLCDAVTQESANDVIRKLWYLEQMAPGKPILLVINSPGGAVDSGFAIWDQLKMITSPITTLITGLAASFGSVLGVVADPDKRFITPHARVMIHQPLVHGVIQGQATDLDIHAKEIIKSRNELIDLYSKATGKDHKAIEKVLDRDTWMNAEEAKDFGLVTKIVNSYGEIGFDPVQ